MARRTARRHGGLVIGSMGMPCTLLTSAAVEGAQPEDGAWPSRKDALPASDLRNLRVPSNSNSLRFKQDPEFWSKSSAPGRWADLDEDGEDSQLATNSM